MFVSIITSHSYFTGQHLSYSCDKISSKHEELQQLMFSSYQVLIKESKLMRASVENLARGGNLYWPPGVFNFEILVVGRS